MARIAMPHIGLNGHLRPAMRFGAALVRQGHEVTAWAPERHRAEIEGTGARFVAHEPVLTRRPWVSLAHFAAELATATERCCGGLIEQLVDREIELVVHDCHVPWGRVAADFLGLPRIVTDPLFPRPWAARPGGAGFDRRRIAPPLAEVAQCRSEIGRRWGVDLGGWSATLHSTGPATVSFTTERILGSSLPPGWSFVGPLLDRVRRTPETPARPLVYVAFGTFHTSRREPFSAAIEALAGEPVDVVVSTGRSVVRPADLGPLPGHVRVHEFVDSQAVLAGAAVHVTHGGCSSVHESLTAGVPMVCVPLGSDQGAWAARVSDLGAGTVVEMKAGAIRAAVRAMLHDDRPRVHAGELATHLAAYDGERRVTDLIEQVLGVRT